MAQKRKRAKPKKAVGYRKATYPSALRMARLVDEMPRHGIGRRVKSVAQDLAISEQTLKRYIKALNEEFVTDGGEPQFTIEKQADEEWLVRRPRYSDTSQASIYQLISVYLSLEFFKMLGANNLFVDMVDGVFREVERKLTISHHRLIRDLPRKFYSAPWAPKDYSKCDEILSDAIKAVVYQCKTDLRYKPVNSEPHAYRIEPLSLLHHRGGLYLIARSPNHETPVYYNIERIQEIKVTTEKFDYPDDYHPEQMLDGAFGIFTGPAKSFTLRFPPELAEYICSRRWHKGQSCEIQADGSVVLSLTVTDSEEVRSWIRAFGEKVEVIE